jgi:serine/threonine-protein kinase
MSWGAGLDIGMMSMEDSREWKPLLQDKYAETQPRISPDGQWLAYMSNESGRFEIYVRPFPDVSSGKWQVSTNGGIEPKWSQDGKRLFYRSDNSIMGVVVTTQPTFSLDTPEVLFRDVRNYSSMDVLRSWDISADGKRVLTVIEAPGDKSQEASRPEINVVLNWFEDLKDRVPVE